MVGINTNLAASSAAKNLGSANSVVQDSIARLSSGNRIIKASDDVAGLAIGTSIKSTVTTLEIALLNTEQARSVLQIADGALSEINGLLQRQSALAVQANSGAVGSTERGYLNQEFQALTAEIDRIVTSTQFNGITLLDGSIAGDAAVSVAAPASTTTNTAAVSATLNVASTATYTTSGTIVTSGVGATGFTTAPDGLSLASFDDTSIGESGFGTISVVSGSFSENGTGAETVEFETTINGKVYRTGVITSSGNGGQIDDNTTITFTEVGGTSAFSIDTANDVTAAIDDTTNAALFATNLTAALAPLSIYQVRAASGLDTSTDAAATLNITAGTVSITSNNFDTTNNDFGTIGEITLVAGSGEDNSLSVVINGTTFSTSDLDSADGGNTLEDGDVITLYGRNAGGDATGEEIAITITSIANSETVDLTDADEVADFALALNQFFNVTPAGTTSTSAFSVNSTTAISGTDVTAIDLTSFDDATYQSTGFGTVTASGFSANSTEVETFTLRTTLGDKTYVADVSTDANGGTVNSGKEVTFTATDGSGSAFTLTLGAATVDDSDAADTLAAAITTGLASVEILQSRTVSSVDATAVTNTILEGLSSTSATLKSNNFDTTNNAFGDVSSFTGTAGSNTANQLTVTINGTVFSATDLGGSDDILSSADSTITLTAEDAVGNATGETLVIDISGLTRSIDLTNSDEMSALTDALNGYFQVSAGNSGGLSFQVGSTVSDEISVSITSAATSNIYLNNSGAYTALDITTQANAQAAIDVLNNATQTIISKRADVGATISRFNFAASNIETSVANQDAARASFLDADIADESTKFAAAQVQVQAGLAMLAQANQIPQGVLSLLQ